MALRIVHVSCANHPRIVVIQGARQVGKTTLLQEIVKERGGRLVSFDDEQTLTLAQNDPLGFLQHDGALLAIDEIELAPESCLHSSPRRAGLVLHTGTTGGAFGDRIAAAPMDALWTT